LLLLAPACSSLAVAAASVNGEKITETEVEAEVDVLRDDPIFGEALRRDPDTRGQRRREILGELIYQSVAKQQAERLDVKVTREQVENLIERSARSRGQSVKEFLADQNLSRSAADRLAERGVRRFQLMDEVVEDVDVDPDAVREVYEGQQDRFVDVHLERIKVADDAAARDVLESPEDHTFEDLDYAPLTSLAAEVQGVVAQAVEGGLTDPLPTQDGVEIYRLVDRRTKSFDDVADDIRSSLTQDERERRFDLWLIERVKDARIVVNPKYGRFDQQAARPEVVPSSAEIRP
jgi:parvulin-like peptidyl-prolyl isomerase